MSERKYNSINDFIHNDFNNNENDYDELYELIQDHEDNFRDVLDIFYEMDNKGIDSFDDFGEEYFQDIPPNYLEELVNYLLKNMKNNYLHSDIRRQTMFNLPNANTTKNKRIINKMILLSDLADDAGHTSDYLYKTIEHMTYDKNSDPSALYYIVENYKDWRDPRFIDDAIRNGKYRMAKRLLEIIDYDEELPPEFVQWLMEYNYADIIEQKYNVPYIGKDIGLIKNYL